MVIIPSMNAFPLLYYLATAVLAGLGGALLCYWRQQRRILELQTLLTRAEAALETEQRVGQERLKTFNLSRQQLHHSFGALASQALQRNSSEFLKLARENLHNMHIAAQGELSRREQSVQNLVQPIREALEKTEQQMQHLEAERKQAYGALDRQLHNMAQAQQLLHKETRRLTQALRRPEVRGQWGELTLKRLVELAGMVEHCDFQRQPQVSGDQGVQRPDMLVRMPGGRQLVVDAKTPLDAYLSAVEADDDSERDRHLQRHARQLAARVRELAAKAYWRQFSPCPDFVVLFIPGDQFLSAALDVQADLVEDALQRKVMLATPTSLVALLRAVAYGWRQESLAENAEQMRVLGEELYSRLAGFMEHLVRVGTNLDNSVKAYNKAIGSLESRVLPGARRFTEMGIQADRSCPTLQSVGTQVRAPATGSGDR